MKKLIILFVIFSTSYINSQWIVQHFYPQYTSVHFVSGTGTGYAVAGGGFLRKSTDYGQNWVNITMNSPHYTLEDVFFINVLTGWAAGDDGVIHKTTNGGVSWVTSVVTTEYIYSIHFYNANTGIMGCSGNKILKTSNGGTNWNVITAGTGFMNAISMLNATTGLAASINAVYRTTNSGDNWTPYSSVTSLPAEMEFVDAQTGFICAPTSIFKTTNAGLNWTSFVVAGSQDIKSLSFLNASTGFACDLNSKIYRTTNTGTSWELSFDAPAPMQHVNIQNSTNIIAVGFNGCIVNSTNAGSSWNIISSGVDVSIEDLQFTSAAEGFMANSSGRVFRSTNSGTNWSQLYYFNDVEFTEMYFFNSTTGWVSGITTSEDCSIDKTTNGGLNWTRSVYTSIGGARSLIFPNANNGYFLANTPVGDGNVKYLYATTNAGVNWQSIYNLPTQTEALHFSSVNTGYAVGTGGMVTKTSNGGLNWIAQVSGTGSDLYSVYFVNNNIGFACGNQNIIATTNGGSNWVIQYTDPVTYLSDMYFYNASNGAAVGEEGKRLHTTNGGLNWISDTEPSGIIALNTVTYSGSSTMYCGGTHGFISTRNSLTGINHNGTEIPESFSVKQNYPNPFNPNTVIQFTLPKTGFVKISVFDISGKFIRDIIKSELNAGSYTADFNGSDLSSGVYFYRLTSGEFTDVKKMVILK